MATVVICTGPRTFTSADGRFTLIHVDETGGELAAGGEWEFHDHGHFVFACPYLSRALDFNDLEAGDAATRKEIARLTTREFF